MKQKWQEKIQQEISPAAFSSYWRVHVKEDLAQNTYEEFQTPI